MDTPLSSLLFQLFPAGMYESAFSIDGRSREAVECHLVRSRLYRTDVGTGERTCCKSITGLVAMDAASVVSFVLVITARGRDCVWPVTTLG